MKSTCSFFALALSVLILFSFDSENVPNNRWNEGLLLDVGPKGNRDTVNFRKIIEGSDKTTFFLNQDEDTINYKTFQNKVVLLDFWFLRCKPCMVQMPNLNRISKFFSNEDFVLVTFSSDPMEEIKSKFLSKTNLDFSVIANTSLSGPNAAPQKYLISKKKRLEHFDEGGPTYIQNILKEEKEYKKMIQKLLYQ